MNEPHEHRVADAGPDFHELLAGETAPEQQTFATAFRGYDKDEVDAALGTLQQRLQRAESEAALARTRAGREADVLRDEASAAQQQATRRIAALEEELAAARAQAADATDKVATLTNQLATVPAEGVVDPDTRIQFEAVLRVAEDQADALLRNATVQSERLLTIASEEIDARRVELEADGARIRAEAEQEADQVRLRIETEFVGHEARIAREAAHAAERVKQAEQEAEAIRVEAEKAATALRSMVARETQQQRADAERDVRETNTRVVEFEESLARRQNDAQQEFLALHNQAVAHAERITSDANDQVQSSLEHAKLISGKADDYERLKRAQAQEIMAEAHVRSRDVLDRARVKAQKIVDTVIGHSTEVLRDAEDRTRQLRWQQQKLDSFMAEVRELIRPDGALTAMAETDVEPASDGDGPLLEADDTMLTENPEAS
ncbi:DivIVA domain-containing protein [Microbacterium halophytorum]|uniref:DivIVA domain-containing protein n=1 Tax=Microbacterium halophytorum TaxID=2067568 RepID=UPI000CFBCFB1|nr:DivIVA domain-containing protein [Microbacterium halophytorum]